MEAARKRVLLIATDELTGPELLAELREQLREAQATEVMMIAPAVEETVFQHALGDVDSAAAEARKRLDASVAELRRAGIPTLGEVGDSDPVIAAGDALRQFAADEVLIVARDEEQARWFEDGLFERAQRELRPAVRMVAIRRDGDAPWRRPVEVSRSGPGLEPPPDADREIELSANLPRFTPGDLAGIAIAIVGTIAAAILAGTGPGVESAGGAAQILIAIGLALVNLAHVVGLILLESAGRRNAAQSLFRNLSTIGTPLGVLASALISIFA